MVYNQMLLQEFVALQVLYIMLTIGSSSSCYITNFSQYSL